MTTIKQGLEFVLENYIDEKRRNLGGNTLAHFIRKGVTESIKENLPLDFLNKFMTYGGCGQANNWAAVPWILISDRDITISAQYGYYLVFLFQENMDGVYISLNQGYTQYIEKFGRHDALIEILSVTRKLRNLARLSLNQLSTEIDLKSESSYAKGYELGHICGKYYKKDTIPTDNLIREDIFSLLDIYKGIKKIVGSDILLAGKKVDDYYNDDDEPSIHEDLGISEQLSNYQLDEDIQSVLDKLEDEFKNKKPEEQKRFAKAIERNQKISNLVKKKFNFVCQVCGYPGFEKINGELFAEAHHIESLGNTGLDIPSNIFCVCPTCHKVLHFGSKQALAIRMSLRNK